MARDVITKSLVLSTDNKSSTREDGTHTRGFTLLEVLIAVVILAVGLLALNSMQGIFATGSGEARYYTRAVQLASQKMEELKNLEYNASALNPTPPGHNETTTQYGKDITLSWQVQENSPRMKEINITAKWQSGSVNRTVSIEGVKSLIEKSD